MPECLAPCRVFALCLAAATAPAQQAELFDDTVLRGFALHFKQANWQSLLTQNYSTKTYIRADLVVDGVTYKDVGVRYRGNSSYKAVRSAKKPFKIAMDAFVPGQDLYGHATINLNNGFRDPSFVREMLSFDLFRRFAPASRASLVNLHINQANFGVYINIEQINKDMLAAWFDDTSGLRYRAERGPGGNSEDPALAWLGTTLSKYQRGYELKSENAVKPWQRLMQTCDVLNNTAAAQMHQAIPKVLDLDGALRYLAMNNVLPAMDSYIGNTAHNFYLYEEPQHGRTVLLPWDHNAAFGANSWLSVAQKQQLDPFYFSNKNRRPLLSRVITDPTWKQRYLAHMRSILDDCYSWTYAAPKIAAWQQLIDAAVQADPLKLYTYAQFQQSPTQDLNLLIGNRYQVIPGIKPMLDRRSAWLRARADFRAVAPDLSGLVHQPRTPDDGDTVWVTVRAGSPVGLDGVLLCWRRVGAFRQDPMFDDGKHGDGKANDGVFGAAIPAQGYGSRVEYYVQARSRLSAGGAMRFAPRTAGFRPPAYEVLRRRQPSPLRINELLADNETVDQDAAGDFDDWVEIHNRSAQAIALGGYHLSDRLLQPRLWAFPVGTSIPAGGFLRVWLDKEPHEGPLHANFSLDKDGELVLIADPQGQVLDFVRFGRQKADRSYGRLPDGADGTFHLWPPSGDAPVLGGTQGRITAYDTRRKGSPLGLRLETISQARVGQMLNLMVFGGVPNQPGLLGLAAGPAALGLGPAGPLLLDPTVLLLLPLGFDATGFAGFSTPIPAAVFGHAAYLQVAGQGLSNALALRVGR